MDLYVRLYACPGAVALQLYIIIFIKMKLKYSLIEKELR